MYKTHKDLELWKESFRNVIQIYAVTQKFPVEERYGLTSQFRRAAVSIPTNIAEGAARKSSKEFIYFLSIARGSLAELDTLLLLSIKLQYLDSKESVEIQNALKNISKLLNGLMTKLRNNSME
jgi:four helix bundle protein